MQFPEELLLEILSWVPVKDLMRFRCVSKLWSTLIFSPTLVKLHLQRSSKNTHVLVTFEDQKNMESLYCAAPCSIHGLLENPLSTFDGAHRFNHNYFLLDVCNGLVCLLATVLFEQFSFTFWNPATRVMLESSVDLPEESSNIPVAFGFGYDDCSDTYKVVAVHSYVASPKIEVRVHCMGNPNPCWRNILTCPAFPILPGYTGPFVSGTVNWLALRRSGYEHQWENVVSINDLVIFSYDLRKETYRFLSMPDGLVEVPPDSPSLKALKGCLCLYHHHRTTHFVVWLMREFGVHNSWTQLLKISYDHLQYFGYSDLPPCPVILCMSENEDVMLLACDNQYRNDSRFIQYNKRDNAIYSHIIDSKIIIWSHDYVQSLAVPYQN